MMSRIPPSQAERLAGIMAVMTAEEAQLLYYWMSQVGGGKALFQSLYPMVKYEGIDGGYVLPLKRAIGIVVDRLDSFRKTSRIQDDEKEKADELIESFSEIMSAIGDNFVFSPSEMLNLLSGDFDLDDLGDGPLKGFITLLSKADDLILILMALSDRLEFTSSNIARRFGLSAIGGKWTQALLPDVLKVPLYMAYIDQKMAARERKLLPFTSVVAERDLVGTLDDNLEEP